MPSINRQCPYRIWSPLATAATFGVVTADWSHNGMLTAAIDAADEEEFCKRTFADRPSDDGQITFTIRLRIDLKNKVVRISEARKAAKLIGSSQNAVVEECLAIYLDARRAEFFNRVGIPENLDLALVVGTLVTAPPAPVTSVVISPVPKAPTSEAPVSVEAFLKYPAAPKPKIDQDTKSDDDDKDSKSSS